MSEFNEKPIAARLKELEVYIKTEEKIKELENLFEEFNPNSTKLTLYYFDINSLEVDCSRFYQITFPSAKEITTNFGGSDDLDVDEILLHSIEFLQGICASSYHLPVTEDDTSSCLQYIPKDVKYNLVDNVQLILHFFDIPFTIRFYQDDEVQINFQASKLSLSHTIVPANPEDYGEGVREFYYVKDNNLHIFNISNFEFKDLVKLSDFSASDGSRFESYEILIPLDKISEAFYEIFQPEDEVPEGNDTTSEHGDYFRDLEDSVDRLITATKGKLRSITTDTWKDITVLEAEYFTRFLSQDLSYGDHIGEEYIEKFCIPTYNDLLLILNGESTFPNVLELYLNFHFQELEKFSKYNVSTLEEVEEVFSKFPNLDKLHVNKLYFQREEFDLLRKISLRHNVAVYTNV